jgi:hypothetical protein
MPGFMLHVGATVVCSDPVPGQATPQMSNPRVRVGGKGTILLLAPYVVSGCGRNSPCTAGSFTQGARRVKSMGQPVVLTDSQSTTVPNASLLLPRRSQTRVRAT